MELVARRLYPYVFFGRGPLPDEVKKSVEKDLAKGVRAFRMRAKFDPYIAGKQLTLADCAAFVHLPLVSISNSQRKPVENANFVSTVLHGLPENLLQFSPKGGDYFAFLGRISPEKRVDRAIENAIALNVPIKVAAKIDKMDKEYHESGIVHLLEHPLVEFVGEIGDDKKSEFLGNARALLFPIDWPEPFGLVMIESMACGTPVVAFRCGAVPEVLEDGVSGFIVDDMDGAIAAARKVGELSREGVRQAFQKRFTSRRMAEEYVDVYRELAAGTRAAMRESA